MRALSLAALAAGRGTEDADGHREAAGAPGEDEAVPPEAETALREGRFRGGFREQTQVPGDGYRAGVEIGLRDAKRDAHRRDLGAETGLGVLAVPPPSRAAEKEAHMRADTDAMEWVRADLLHRLCADVERLEVERLGAFSLVAEAMELLRACRLLCTMGWERMTPLEVVCWATQMAAEKEAHRYRWPRDARAVGRAQAWWRIVRVMRDAWGISGPLVILN
jgi:hypothetical protein